MNMVCCCVWHCTGVPDSAPLPLLPSGIQPQDDHSGEIPSPVKCSQDVGVTLGGEIGTDGDGSWIERIIASGGHGEPGGHRSIPD